MRLELRFDLVIVKMSYRSESGAGAAFENSVDVGRVLGQMNLEIFNQIVVKNHADVEIRRK